MMEIEKCFEILELRPGASPEEIRAAYRDAVAVWHPDRFANNPRLKRKAEEKLKEINEAYEILISTESLNGSTARCEGQKEINVEKIAEVGTRLFLHACHFVAKKIKAL